MLQSLEQVPAIVTVGSSFLLGLTPDPVIENFQECRPCIRLLLSYLNLCVHPDVTWPWLNITVPE